MFIYLADAFNMFQSGPRNMTPALLVMSALLLINGYKKGVGCDEARFYHLSILENGTATKRPLN